MITYEYDFKQNNVECGTFKYVIIDGVPYVNLSQLCLVIKHFSEHEEKVAKEHFAALKLNAPHSMGVSDGVFDLQRRLYITYQNIKQKNHEG